MLNELDNTYEVETVLLPMSACEGYDVMLNVVLTSNVFAMNAVEKKITSFAKLLVWDPVKLELPPISGHLLAKYLRLRAKNDAPV